MKEYGFNTTLLHGIRGDKNPFGATQVPVYQSSAFRHDTAEELEKIFANKTVPDIHIPESTILTVEVF